MSDKPDLDGIEARLDDGWSEGGPHRKGGKWPPRTQHAVGAIDRRDAVISELLTAHRELEREVDAVKRAIESAEFDIGDDRDSHSNGVRRVVDSVREAMAWPRRSDEPNPRQ